jgi:hypothetical protein
MNLTLQLQELDDLVVSHTQPPTTPILRQKIQSAIEQAEAQESALVKITAERDKLNTNHSELHNQYSELQKQLATLIEEYAKPFPPSTFRRPIITDEGMRGI